MTDPVPSVSDPMAAWRALSSAQRRLLLDLGERYLWRERHNRNSYAAIGAPHATAHIAGRATVRALVERHGVLIWAGPAADREIKAVLSPRGGAALSVVRQA